MENLEIKYDLDHLETLGRKDGILYVRKAYFRKRDLVGTLISSLGRTVILISVGRHFRSIENMQYPNLKSLIRVKGNEVNGLLNWSEDMDTFRYVASSIEKAILLSGELAQRGDVVLFSPFGTRDEIEDWYNIYQKHLNKLAFSS